MSTSTFRDRFRFATVSISRCILADARQKKLWACGPQFFGAGPFFFLVRPFDVDIDSFNVDSTMIDSEATMFATLRSRFDERAGEPSVVVDGGK